jgi:hypothetical protein
MNIQVNDFRWEPGKNDAEYIRLLESSRDEWQKIAKRAIAKLTTLSKAQELRVMTLEEIKEGEPYWLSAGKEFVTRPVICLHREDDAQKQYITFVWQFGTFSWESEDYGKTWRVWSAKPTDEQREAVKWNG